MDSLHLVVLKFLDICFLFLCFLFLFNGGFGYFKIASRDQNFCKEPFNRVKWEETESSAIQCHPETFSQTDSSPILT